MMFNFASKKKNIVALFRDETVLHDDIIWLILEQAGITGSGTYSMFFWVYC